RIPRYVPFPTRRSSDLGENGLILKTADGGANWLVQISNITSHLYGVYAMNAKEAHAVGLNGMILSTNDGGTTWARDFSNTSTARSEEHTSELQSPDHLV